MSKHIIFLDSETNKMLEAQAKEAQSEPSQYIKLCLISCKSDAGVMHLSNKEKHKAIMTVFGLDEKYTREDIIASTLQDIYDYIMSLKVVS